MFLMEREGCSKELHSTKKGRSDTFDGYTAAVNHLKVSG